MFNLKTWYQPRVVQMSTKLDRNEEEKLWQQSWGKQTLERVGKAH